jgi:hypothetical protein
LSGALHDDLVLRVRAWRAGTFAIARAQGKVHEGPIGAQMMRLLSAVSPIQAIEEAYNQLDQIYQLGRETEVLSTQDTEALRTLVKKRQRSKEALQSLQSLHALAKSFGPGDLATAMDAAIIAVGCAYVDHPINKLGQGRFVPAASDIGRINIRDPRLRRTP